MPDSQNTDPSAQRPGGHSGVAGKKRAKTKPKGRMVDPAAVTEVSTILGAAPDQRDMLIRIPPPYPR